jgi:3-methyladenine DNA glycosylase AlkD
MNTDLNPILEKIRIDLKASSDSITEAISKHFFKEEIKSYGVKSANVDKIAKEYFKILAGKSKEEILDFCDALWQSGYIEESFIACNWSYFLHNQFQPVDFYRFEKWVNTYVSNWASCDTLCNHTIGEFVQRYPEYLNELKKWTKSKNRWVRRASAVTLIIPARKGKFLNDILEIADSLLLDKDDLVQKGYGWMLKASSQFYPNEIFKFVLSRKSIMPRTALRYAIEKMPKELRELAMKK